MIKRERISEAIIVKFFVSCRTSPPNMWQKEGNPLVNTKLLKKYPPYRWYRTNTSEQTLTNQQMTSNGAYVGNLAFGTRTQLLKKGKFNTLNTWMAHKSNNSEIIWRDLTEPNGWHNVTQKKNTANNKSRRQTWRVHRHEKNLPTFCTRRDAVQTKPALKKLPLEDERNCL